MSALRESIRATGVALAQPAGLQARFMGLHSNPLLHKHREVVYHLASNEQVR